MDSFRKNGVPSETSAVFFGGKEKDSKIISVKTIEYMSIGEESELIDGTISITDKNSS